MSRACPACSTANAGAARFCGECGAALKAGAARSTSAAAAVKPPTARELRRAGLVTCVASAAFLIWHGPFPGAGHTLKWVNAIDRAAMANLAAAVVLLVCAYAFHRASRWAAILAGASVGVALAFGFQGDGWSLGVDDENGEVSLALEFLMVAAGLTAGWFGCREPAAEAAGLRAPSDA